MVGGHLDSWIAGTGATDNGAGSVVALEVMRILNSLKVKPRRTIRIALWSGEEQGLFGSKGYVKGTLWQLPALHCYGPDGIAGIYEEGGGPHAESPSRNSSPPISTSTTERAKFGASTRREIRRSTASLRNG